MIKRGRKSRRSQAQVITTVLLILIAIAAVAIISTFVINLVRQQLGGTECFQTIGQISISLGAFTHYNETNESVTVGIEVGQIEANVSGFVLSIGSEQAAKAYRVEPGGPARVYMYYNPGSVVELPGPGEKRTYTINVAGENLGKVNKVTLAPILGRRTCDPTDEQSIPSVV